MDKRDDEKYQEIENEYEACDIQPPIKLNASCFSIKVTINKRLKFKKNIINIRFRGNGKQPNKLGKIIHKTNIKRFPLYFCKNKFQGKLRSKGRQMKRKMVNFSKLTSMTNWWSLIVGVSMLMRRDNLTNNTKCRMIKSRVPLINGDMFTEEDRRFCKLMKRIEKIEFIFILAAERLTLED